MNLLRMSFSGAVIIIVIVILRSLAIYRLPKWIFPAMWIAVSVRLLFPYSLPSAYSIASLTERITATVQEKKTAGTENIGTFAENSLGASWQQGDSEFEFFFDLPLPDSALSGISLPVMLWIFGALGFALFFVIAYVKCVRVFRESLPVENDFTRRWLTEHECRRNIVIRCSDRISAPLTYGLLHPVILVPKTADWNDTERMDYVLLHEYVHIRHLDAALKLLFTAVLCVHWFNPAVWVMYVLANRDIELFCDEGVLGRLGKTAKKEYAMLLLQTEKARSLFTPFCNNFGKNAVEERIVAILHKKKMSALCRIAVGILTVALLFPFFTTAKPEAKETGSGEEKEFGINIKEEDTMGITMDYSYLLEQMFGISGNTGSNEGMFGGRIKVSDLSSPSVQEQLRKAGIDTGSAQYKAVIGRMMQANKGGTAYCNIQGIKNQMSLYNADGDFTAGGLVVPGMDATGIPESERHQIIDISEEARQKMFDNCKREFIAEYGVANGDTTKRSDVFREFQLSIKKEDRLKGTWTLGQYERQYNLAMYEAVKAANPDWKPGQPFDVSILDNVTRESVDSTLIKSGNTLIKSSSVSGSKIDIRM